MTKRKTITIGPGFNKGLQTALDGTLNDGWATFNNADISKGVLRGIYGVGTALDNIGTYQRFLHYGANDDWMHSSDLNWAFDDAAQGARGQRITYRTNLGGTSHVFPTVYHGAINAVPAKEYRLGIDAPGGTHTVSGGTGGQCTYALTFRCPDTGVESNPLNVSGIATGPHGATIATLPTFPTHTSIPDPNRTNVKVCIYRTAANDPTGTKYYLTEVASGTTSFTDNTGTYAIDTASPLDWGDGGYPDNETLPSDHRPALALWVLPNAMHSVNEGAGGQGSGIIVAGMGNWLVWSMLGYPHYWPAVNQMRLDENVTCVYTVDAMTYAFTANEVYAISGVADYALSIVKTAAPFGVSSKYSKTVAKTPIGLVWLSREGLVVFDGANVRNLTDGLIDPYDLLSQLGANDIASGAYYQGHYFLSFEGTTTYVFDLRNPASIVVTKYAGGFSSFTITRQEVDGVAPGLVAASVAGTVVPWRPRDQDLVPGAYRRAFFVRTGELTVGEPARRKRFIRCRAECDADTTLYFFLDGSATPSHTHAGPGLFWLPSAMDGRTLEVEAYGAAATSYLEAIEIECEVFNGA